MNEKTCFSKSSKMIKIYSPAFIQNSKIFEYNLTISTLVGELFTKSEFMRG